jgi:hypothetical protein
MGPATMKPTTATNVSVDGVMQGCDGPDEDRGGGFERGGWSMPLRRFDPRDARDPHGRKQGHRRCRHEAYGEVARLRARGCFVT